MKLSQGTELLAAIAMIAATTVYSVDGRCQRLAV